MTETDAGKRIDAWLASVSGIRRTEIQRMITNGAVRFNGAAPQKSLQVVAGMVVEIDEPIEVPVHAPPAPFDVRYEDEWIAVINKPAGVVVHPGHGNEVGTLVQSLAANMELAADPEGLRPGIVHRIDKQTSGLLVIAKTEAARDRLTEMLKQHEVERAYVALVAGTFAISAGRIEARIGRSTRDRTRMAVADDGKEAVSSFAVTEQLEGLSLLNVGLATGRTHQVRVHLAHIDHPVIGDPTYGKKTLPTALRLGLPRLFLHAGHLRFAHPITSAQMDIREALPHDLIGPLALARAGTW